MKCSICKNLFDHVCSGFEIDEIPKLKPGYLATWNCVICCGGRRRGGDNSGTPVRAALGNTEGVLGGAEVSDTNVTVRNKRKGIIKSSTDKARPLVPPTTIHLKSPPPSSSSSSPNMRVDEYKLREIIRKEITSAINESVNKLISNELNTIKVQLTEFAESLTFFNNKYEDVRAGLEVQSQTMANLERDNAHLKTTVNELTTRLQSVEQNLRENNIEINGLPEHKTENLLDTMMQLGRITDCPLEKQDVLKVSRVARLSQKSDDIRPRAVVVRLQSHIVRDTIIAAVAKFNKKNPQDKLSSHHLGLGGTRCPVYVSEHLSPFNKALHAAARLKAKALSYRFVWVRNGRIYVRKNETSQAVHIRCKDSLAKIV